jgi:uncharacterized protein (DUF2267 family)
VDYETFVETVRQHVGGAEVDAELAIKATLQTLGERIDRGEARQLAALLPPELGPWIATATPAQALDVDEFVRRVAGRDDADPMTAARHIAAVFDALAQAAPKEWDNVVSELPRTFAPLLPRGPFVRVTDTPTFLEQVAAHAGTGLSAADRATDAVLQTLAERIAGGEVEDLLERLPIELHPPLKRGRAAVGGHATPLRLDTFIQRIAAREGVCIIEAMLHARAVFRALRDALGEQEYRDIAVQLPQDYVEALAR